MTKKMPLGKRNILKTAFIKTKKKFHKLTPPQKGGVFFVIAVFVFIIAKNTNENSKPSLENTQIKPDIVNLKAENHDRVYHVTGQIHADQFINVRSEVHGKVLKKLVNPGDFVTKDTEILHLIERDQIERLEQAKARLKQRELEFSASEKLSKKGFKSETSQLQSKANLEQAKADLAAAEHEIDKIHIKAPFSGFIDDIVVDPGDVIKPEMPLAILTNLSLMNARFHVSENIIQKLSRNSKVRIHVKGMAEKISGKISVLSTSANSTTRTYLVEAKLDKLSDVHLLHGQTCEGEVITDSVKGYLLPISALNLDEDGRVGVKIIEDGTVKFVPVDISQIQKDKILITNLPDEVQMIRFGGEFINDGESVSIGAA